MQQMENSLARWHCEMDGAKVVDGLAVLRKAVDTYQRIGLIHPFADGNGRVARLAMNHILRRYNCAYVVFPPLPESQELWEGLQEAHRGHPERLIRFAQQCEHDV
jgi:fido (protein-threonine AMPylation protein)